MRLIIDIPEDMYNDADILIVKDLPELKKIITNGIPLPKGHGELIDKDVVLDMMNHGILEDYITTIGGIIPADK